MVTLRPGSKPVQTATCDGLGRRLDVDLRHANAASEKLEFVYFGSVHPGPIDKRILETQRGTFQEDTFMSYCEDEGKYTPVVRPEPVTEGI